MKRSYVAMLGALLPACQTAEDDEPQFECSSMTDVDFCDDFNGGTADAWSTEGGSWTVEEGRYVGSGPTTIEGECGASLMTAALRRGVTAANVQLHAGMTSEARLDKVIVLRATGPSNRIELNFRADPINDLMVQELVDCELVFHTEEGEIVVPHAVGEALEAEVTLEGNHLIVIADGQTVLDREIAFANQAEGNLGVAVITDAITTFDDVWMRAR